MDINWVLFLSVSLLLVLSPGPDTILMVKNSRESWWKSSFPTVMGILVGLVFHVFASFYGLSTVLSQSAETYRAIRVLGAVYLIYIGMKSILSAQRWIDGAAKNNHSFRSAFDFFREGFISNVLNPKVALFYVSYIPQFIGIGDNFFIHFLILSTIHIGLSAVWLFIISVFVKWFLRLLNQPSVKQKIDFITGGVLSLLGLKLALSET